MTFHLAVQWRGSAVEKIKISMKLVLNFFLEISQIVLVGNINDEKNDWNDNNQDSEENSQ